MVAQTPTLDKLETAIVETNEGRVGFHLKRHFSLNTQEAIAQTEGERTEAERAKEIREIIVRITQGMKASGKDVSEEDVSNRLMETFTNVGQETLKRHATNLAWRYYNLFRDGNSPDDPSFTEAGAPLLQQALNESRRSIELNVDLIPYGDEITRFTELLANNDRDERLLASVIRERVVVPPNKESAIPDFSAEDARNLGDLLQSEISMFVNAEVRGDATPANQQNGKQETESQTGEEREAQLTSGSG